MDGEPSREEQQDNQQCKQENPFGYLFVLYDECPNVCTKICFWRHTPRLQDVDTGPGLNHLLNASFTFSPACFRLPLVWSALPSARRWVRAWSSVPRDLCDELPT